MNSKCVLAAAVAVLVLNSAAPGAASDRFQDSGAMAVPDMEATVDKAQAAEDAGAIDETTTSSIAPEKPELVARARKSSSTEGAAAKVATPKTQYTSIISSYAQEYGVPVALAHAVVGIESGYRASARGSAGEIGLMQIKPATARMMGYSGSAKGLYDPETNVKYGMKYLAKARALGGGDTCGTILKYNAGHGAKRMNPVSAAYCNKVKRTIGG